MANSHITSAVPSLESSDSNMSASADMGQPAHAKSAQEIIEVVSPAVMDRAKAQEAPDDSVMELLDALMTLSVSVNAANPAEPRHEAPQIPKIVTTDPDGVIIEVLEEFSYEEDAMVGALPTIQQLESQVFPAVGGPSPLNSNDELTDGPSRASSPSLPPSPPPAPSLPQTPTFLSDAELHQNYGYEQPSGISSQQNAANEAALPDFSFLPPSVAASMRARVARRRSIEATQALTAPIIPAFRSQNAAQTQNTQPPPLAADQIFEADIYSPDELFWTFLHNRSKPFRKITLTLHIHDPILYLFDTPPYTYINEGIYLNYRAWNLTLAARDVLASILTLCNAEFTIILDIFCPDTPIETYNFETGEGRGLMALNFGMNRAFGNGRVRQFAVGVRGARSQWLKREFEACLSMPIIQV